MREPSRDATLAVVALAVLALLIGGGVVMAGNAADKDKQEEREAAAATEREAKKEKAETATFSRSQARAFCKGNRSTLVLDDDPVALAYVLKRCPDMRSKIMEREARRVKKALAQEATEAAEDADETEDDQVGAKGPDGVSLQAYCYSRYTIVTEGNGPGSPYSDYTDQDLVEIGAEFDRYCQSWEPPNYAD